MGDEVLDLRRFFGILSCFPFWFQIFSLFVGFYINELLRFCSCLSFCLSVFLSFCLSVLPSYHLPFFLALAQHRTQIPRPLANIPYRLTSLSLAWDLSFPLPLIIPLSYPIYLFDIRY